MTDTAPSTPGVVSTRASALRIGLTGAAVAALVAVGILAVASTASPGSIRASSSSSGSTTTTGLSRAFDLGGPAGRGGIGLGAITITAVDGSKLSLETPDGWTRTITVDDGTTYTKSGGAISLSDLNVGDEIRFRQTLESDGTYSIDEIVVIPPHLGGVVTAVSGSTITLRLADGSSGTVKVNDSTKYAVGSDDSAALADIEVGMVLFATGTDNADGSLAASAVHAGNFGGLLGRGPGGFGHDGFGPDWHDDANPGATASPSAT